MSLHVFDAPRSVPSAMPADVPAAAQFKKAITIGTEAFNRRDLATAFALVAPDCEWQIEDFPYGGGAPSLVCASIPIGSGPSELSGWIRP